MRVNGGVWNGVILVLARSARTPLGASPAGVFDKPHDTLSGVGTADALAEAFIAFASTQTAE